jgi:PAS domain S-box-containing protein
MRPVQKTLQTTESNLRILFSIQAFVVVLVTAGLWFWLPNAPALAVFTVLGGLSTNISLVVWGPRFVKLRGSSGTSQVLGTPAVEALYTDLLLSESRFRDFADSASDFFWETDPEHRFSWFSSLHENVTGVNPNDLLGQRRMESSDVEADREQWAEHADCLASHQPFRDFEYSRTATSGHQRWFRISGRPVFDIDHEFCGYRGSGLDITDTLEQEQRTRRAEVRFREAMDRIPEGFALFDANDELVSCNGEYARRFHITADPADWVGQTFVSLLDQTITANFRRDADDVKRMVGARLARHNEGKGTPFTLLLDDGSTLVLRDYTTADNGRMVLITDVTILNEFESALQTSNQRLRDFSDVAADWFWETDEHGRFSYLSGRFEELTGIKRDEYLGRTRTEVFGDNELPEGLLAIEHAIEQHEPFDEIVYSRSDPAGGMHHFRVSGKPLFDAHRQFRGYRGSGTEITEQVQAQQRLRTAETRLVAALEASTDGVAVFDAHDRLVLSNSVYRESFIDNAFELGSSVTFEDILRSNHEKGLIIVEQASSDWLGGRQAHHDKATGQPLDVRRSDGAWTQIRDFRTSDGGTLVVISDITNQKIREGDLRRSEQRLRDYAETAVDWFWEADTRLRLTYLSDRFTALTGDSTTPLLGQRITQLGKFEHQRGGDRLARTDLRAHKPFRDITLRYTVTSGQHHFLRVSGRPHYDENEQFTGYRGSGTDITREVENQQRSAALETRLAAAIAAVHDGFALFDANDKLVVVNDTWRTFYPGTAHIKVPGTSFETMIRADLAAGFIPDTEGREEQYLAERMARHKNPGEPIESRYSNNLWLRIDEHRTPDGEYVLIASDITSLKRRESELIESEQRFKAFAQASGDWFWEMDIERRLTDVWGAQSEIAEGAPLIVGRTLDSLALAHTPTASASKWADIAALMSEGKVIAEFHLDVATQHDERQELVLNGRAMLDAKDSVTGYRGVARDVTTRRRIERMLRSLAVASAANGMQEIIETSIQSLAEVFGVDFAMVGLIDETDPTRVNTQAVWVDGGFGDNYSYALKGTPCADCIHTARGVLIPSGVAAAYPDDADLIDGGVDAYFGVPMSGRDGASIGVLVLADRRPMKPPPILAPLPEIVAGRLAAEIERDRASIQLARSEQHLRSIFEHAPVVFELKDHEGRYLRVSPTFEAIYGKSPTQVIGLLPADVLGPEVGAVVELADRHVLKHGEPEQIEEIAQSANGAMTLLVQRFPIPDENGDIRGIGSAATDITALKIAESQATDAYELLRTSVESINEGFALYDRDGVLVMCNEKSRQLYPEFAALLKPGATHETLLTALAESVSYILDNDSERQTFVERRLNALQSDRVEEIHLAGGRWIELRVSATTAGGTIVLSIDVTSRKENEQALANYRDQLESRVLERTRALEEAQQELVKTERLATIGRLSATVSHELRNPLGALRNAAYLLKRRLPSDDEKATKYLGIIERELHHSSRIIDDLLETTRVKDPHFAAVNLADLIEETRRVLDLPDTVSVSCEMVGGDRSIEADPLQLRQVFGNLMTNAAQAMDFDGEIRIRAIRHAHAIEITVADNGPGIDKALHDRLFEPLFTTKSKGNGLGLWISREIIRRHDGDLLLCQEGAEGATFRLTLPLRETGEGMATLSTEQTD